MQIVKIKDAPNYRKRSSWFWKTVGVQLLIVTILGIVDEFVSKQLASSIINPLIILVLLVGSLLELAAVYCAYRSD